MGRSSAGSHTGSFFAIVLTGTALVQLPALLAHHGALAGGVKSWMGLAALGLFMPIGAAMFVTWREGELGSFLRSCVDVRTSPLWYLVALLGFWGLHAAGAAVDRSLGGATEWLYLPRSPEHIAAMIIVPLTEEPGWRGFALPRLATRHGPLRASLILGVAWAAWHTFMFIIQGWSPAVVALGMVNIFAGSVVFAWLYFRSGRKTPVAIVAHAGVHLNNPTHALPDATPFLLFTAALGLAAVALVTLDRAAWRRAGANESSSP